MKKLKVLQINKLYYPVTGGIERVVQQLAEGLKDETDMKVLVCKEKGKTSVDSINGVMVYRAGSFGVFSSLPLSFSFIWELRKLSKDRDILHFHMPFPLGDIACLLSGYKGKVIVWWHSDIVRQKKLMKLYQPIMNRFLKRADVIIVATQGHIQGSKYLRPFKDKCVIIPFGVDKKIEQQADKWYQNKKQEIKKTITFLFVGRLVYYKGCKVLLEAFKEVKDAKLIMIGNGPMELELKNLVQSYNIQDRVQFLGNIKEEELVEYFKFCDVFVLPSIVRSEAFGLVQIEAMVYGKPVINTNLPSGVPYVSLNHITGLTVPPGNKKALARAMNWMVEHKEERLKMGERARQRVKMEYEMDTMLKRILDLYQKFTRNKKDRNR